MSPVYPVSSSNVQDVWTDGNDLYVRFLPKKGRKPWARTWVYPGGAKELAPMLASASKGVFVWTVLRPNYPGAHEV
jgi:hypothetical protein